MRQGELSLAILLTAAPPHPGVDAVIAFARAAMAEGLRAAVFMMDDGVHAAGRLAEALGSESSGSEVPRAMLGGGLGAGDASESDRAMVQLVRCSQDARERGAAPAGGVIEGSQADWARMVAAAKVVLRFG